MIVIVAYDITSERRRVKVFKEMHNWGKPIQYSLFQCDINASQRQQMEEAIKNLINRKRDRVDVFPICYTCIGKSKHIGKNMP
jgi:CRISPR-associated protein Cas2